MPSQSPEAIAKWNVRHFIIFRTLFNSRFYYPVFAIIFLDFGLTIEQFALLNVIWAVTIIVAEVPSGALSDLFGRKKLLWFTALLMVAEMVTWAFAPRTDPTVLFWVLAMNRILSGLGEASASGSDEALVYDSLEQAGMKGQWSNVLAKTQRFQAFGFMLAMVLGGLIYDYKFVQILANWAGMDVTLSQDTTLRWPLILNVLTALAVLYVSLRFVEPGEEKETRVQPKVRYAFKQTWEAGKWIGRTPFALIVIAAGAYADSVIRMFITLASEYYRMIEFTPVTFGIIGAGMSGLSILVASLSKWLVDTHSPTFNFFAICTVALLGFYGSTFFIPYWGLLFVIMLFVAFSVTTYCISYYLNHVSEKSRRATVLSFKGMALNLGYGFIGWLYALLGKYLREDPTLTTDKDAHFMAGMGYFPIYFAIGTVAVVLFALWRCPKPTQTFREMGGEKGAANR